MTDDWQWFWASEQGRDRILRNELEGLQIASNRASERSSRLNSQLAQLQGSIESRLEALSSAFDAYVELGDVREQLDGYPDTAAIRRDAAAAIDQLGRGAAAPPVDARGVDYWLPYAVNAVIALAAGRQDPEAERHAVELDRDAEMFVVAAAGALGQGPRVAARVPDLLVCDGVLTEHQLSLWKACSAGVYGDVLPAVRPRWAASLDTAAASDDWVNWVHSEAHSPDAEEALRWLDRESAVLTGPDDAVPVPPAAPVPTSQPVEPDPKVWLRSVVAELIGRGAPGEADLLTRARNLRAQIEKPGAEQRPTAPSGSASLVPVDVAVRLAYAGADPGSALRRELLGWIAAPLVAALGRLAAEATKREPGQVALRTPGGTLSIPPTGPDPAKLQRVKDNIALNNTGPTRKFSGSVGIGIAFVLLAVVAGVAGGSASLVLVLVVSALAAAAVAVLTRRELVVAGERRQAELRDLEVRLEQTVDQAKAESLGRDQRDASLVSLTEALRQRLGGTAQAGLSASGDSR